MPHSPTQEHSCTNIQKELTDFLKGQEQLQNHFEQFLITIDERTFKTEKQLDDIFKCMNTLTDKLSQIQVQVQRNTEGIDSLNKRMGDLERELEKSEERRIKFNLMFFGISEARNEKENCTNTVNEILSTHYQEWEGVSGIKDAFRIGKRQKDNNSPRPILAVISSWENVMKILGNQRGRKAMKANGIRVTQEKNKKQQNTLNHMRSQGRVGFVHKGQVFERKDGKVVRYRDIDPEAAQEEGIDLPSKLGQAEHTPYRHGNYVARQVNSDRDKHKENSEELMKKKHKAEIHAKMARLGMQKNGLKSTSRSSSESLANSSSDHVILKTNCLNISHPPGSDQMSHEVLDSCTRNSKTGTTLIQKVDS